MSTNAVIVTALDGVRLVEMNLPETGNCTNEAMHHALAATWPAIADDPAARAVVLTGRGESFCAGVDVDWVTSVVADPFESQRAVHRDREIMNALRAFRLPTIAAVNGRAIGLGCSLAIHCDLVFMGASATLCDSHVLVGVPCGDGSAAMMPALAPIMQAKRYLFTGDPIPAKVAVELGLALEVVPDDQLLDHALAFARRLAVQPPQALQATKRAINLHLGHAVNAAEFASYAEAAALSSQEFRDVFDKKKEEVLKGGG